jgi:hypothetical protein
MEVEIEKASLEEIAFANWRVNFGKTSLYGKTLNKEKILRESGRALCL